MFKKMLKKILGTGNILKIKNILKPFKIEEIIVDVAASCNAQCPFCPRVFMPEERSIDIDNELDFKFVEFLMANN